jgi:hypothetical protein
MRILFLHGWQSTPGGIKPTYLKDHGHEVLNPALPDDDFDAAVRIAQAEFDRGKPDVVVGSSRGGAVAMNIDSGSMPLVLMCPAWKRFGTATTVKPGTVILHSKADDVVPFADSDELVQNSGLPSGSLIEVGHEHRLADPESLAKMAEIVNCASPGVTETAMVIDRRNIIAFIDEPRDESFQLLIRGHLYLEALLSEIIDRSYPEPDALDELASMFYRKVKLVRAVGRISSDVEDLLLSINSVRNKLAHKLEYELDFATVFALVTKAHQAGIDFSDDGIHLDKNQSEQHYGLYGVIHEVICNTFSHLIWENEDIFSQEDVDRFLA